MLSAEWSDGVRLGPVGSDLVRWGPIGSDGVISHTRSEARSERSWGKTTESDCHPNPTTNPNPNPNLVAVRYGSLAGRGAESGSYRNILERGAAFSPLTWSVGNLLPVWVRINNFGAQYVYCWSYNSP